MKRFFIPCLMSAVISTSLWGATSQNMIGRQSQNEGISAVPAKQAVRIDGDLKEWDLSGEIWSFMDTAIRDTFSVKTSAMWDADNLYLSFNWRDPMPLNSKINPDFNPSRGWMADAVQLRIVAGEQVLWITSWCYDGTRPCMTIDWWNDPNRCSSTTSKLYKAAKPGDTKIGDGIESAYKKSADGKGFVHELKIPWKLLYRKDKKMAAGENIRMGMEFMWGSVNSGWPMHRYADNMQPGVTSREFFWTAKKAWGNLSMISNSVKSPRKYVSDESKPEGTVKVRAQVPSNAKTFTIVIDNEAGQRIRNLAGEFSVEEYTVSKKNGIATVEVNWDCLDDLGNLVSPGKYKVRGLSQNGLTVLYDSCFYNPGTPAWDTANGKGGWGADHNPVQYAAAAGDSIVLCSTFAEGGAGTFAVGPDFKKCWHETKGTSVVAANDKYIFTVPNDWGASGGALLRLDRKTGKFIPFVLKDGKTSDMPYSFGKLLGISGKKNEKGDFMNAKGKEIFPAPLAIGVSGDTLVIVLDDGMLYTLDGEKGTLKKKESLTIQGFEKKFVKRDDKVTYSYPFAFDGKNVFFFRRSELIRRDLASAKETVVKLKPDCFLSCFCSYKPGKAVAYPSAMTLDKAGNIYIADVGADLQVKKFSPDGKMLQRFGKKGGRAKYGKYEKDGMRYMSSCAVDAKGNLWVVEFSNQPRRVSVWDPNGKYLREFIGNSGYAGTGTTIHDNNPDMVYAEGNELVRTGSRTWEVANVMFNTDAPKDSFFPVRADGVSASANEHIFFSKASGALHEYNVATKDIRGVTLCVSVRKADGNWKPAAVIARLAAIQKLMGGLYGSQIVKPCFGVFEQNDPCDVVFWSDLNGDGFIQKEECEIAPAIKKMDWKNKHRPMGASSIPLGGVGWGQQVNTKDFAFYTSASQDILDAKKHIALAKGLYQFKPVKYLADGTPVYSAKGMKKVSGFTSDEVVPVPGTDLTINFVPHKRFMYFISGINVKTGKQMWRYPDFYHQVHGSHGATMPKNGMVIGSLRILGVVPVKSGYVFAVRGNLGQDYFITTDGLFVTSLFQDCRLPNIPLPGKEEELVGMPLNIYSGGGEHFTGAITKHDDGVIRMNCGIARQAGMILKIDGLDSIKRFTAPAISISSADLVKADKDNTVRAAALAKPQEPYTVEKVTADKKGNVSLNRMKPFGINRQGLSENCTFRAGYDSNNLYLEYRVNESSPWINNGKDWKLLFKTGDAVDFLFSHSGNTKRNAVEGDMRILIAPFQGKNTVVMMKPVAKDALPSEKFNFTSPVQTITFAQVKLISDVKVKVTKSGTGYVAFVTIPWKLLGVTPAAGTKLRCDVGFILSDASGLVNMARIYRTNRHTNLVNDIPGEATLNPSFWGEFILGK